MNEFSPLDYFFFFFFCAVGIAHLFGKFRAPVFTSTASFKGPLEEFLAKRERVPPSAAPFSFLKKCLTPGLRYPFFGSVIDLKLFNMAFPLVLSPSPPSGPFRFRVTLSLSKPISAGASTKRTEFPPSYLPPHRQMSRGGKHSFYSLTPPSTHIFL